MFEYDKINLAWYLWSVRWGYIELVEWIEENHPTAVVNY